MLRKDAHFGEAEVVASDRRRRENVLYTDFVHTMHLCYLAHTDLIEIGKQCMKQKEQQKKIPMGSFFVNLLT